MEGKKDKRNLQVTLVLVFSSNNLGFLILNFDWVIVKSVSELYHKYDTN